MQRSLNTPHPAGLEFRLPSRVPLNAGLSQRTWRHQWRPTQGREKIGPPLPVLFSSFCFVFLVVPWDRGLACPWIQPWLESEGGKEAREEGATTRRPECEGVVTVTREPVDTHGFQPFLDISSGPRTRPLPPPSPTQRARISPSPVLVCSRSSLQPQEIQLLQEASNSLQVGAEPALWGLVSGPGAPQ